MLRIIGRDPTAKTCPACRQHPRQVVAVEEIDHHGRPVRYGQLCHACATADVLGLTGSLDALERTLDALELAIAWVNSCPADADPEAWAETIAAELAAGGVHAWADHERVVIEHAGAVAPGQFVPT